ncbi:lipase [Legionella norrlandica]|uniref:Lipase n=1 Tax=Legionella norrlandica TaxID=1498499 RepID=A0A0A2STK0_9GAMM|nr:lipase [Legionella norrlandica]
MAAYEERKITFCGFSIALKIWNPENSNPVLCLHGKLDNAASFDLLAPLLADRQLVAVDYPGTGLSSHYPDGVVPHWKNDAFLMCHVIKALGWKYFDIIAHSLGSFLANVIAIYQPKQVRKLVFLDILGPTVHIIENSVSYLPLNIETYLTYGQHQRSVFASQDSAIKDRMAIGNVSYQAAQALVRRGTKRIEEGWVWTFDPRLRCISSTIPHEDETRAMLRGIEVPVCLILADQGVSYPQAIFEGRAQSIRDLTIHRVQGGHHVHMDNPAPVAKIISQYLGS